MAIVKIFLEPGETPEEAQEMLQKAYQYHAAGGEHKQAFHDPAPRDVFNKLINEHDKMLSKMLKEILEVLNEDN